MPVAELAMKLDWREGESEELLRPSSSPAHVPGLRLSLGPRSRQIAQARPPRWRHTAWVDADSRPNRLAPEDPALAVIVDRGRATVWHSFPSFTRFVPSLPSPRTGSDATMLATQRVEEPALPAVPSYPCNSPWTAEVDQIRQRFLYELDHPEDGWVDLGERDGVQLWKKWHDNVRLVPPSPPPPLPFTCAKLTVPSLRTGRECVSLHQHGSSRL